jgi:hypothetical protein
MYVRGSDSTANPLILWSPVNNDNCQLLLKSPEELQKLHPEFSAHSRYFPGYNGPLFKSSNVGNYQLLQAFPGSEAGTQLPSEVSNLLGQSKRFIGAYSPLP